MGKLANTLFFLLFLAAQASGQIYTFECMSGARLTGDSCDICPGTAIEAKSFNGLVIYREGEFYKWFDQPYSIRIKPGEIVEYWEHSVSPYNERVSIALELTDFFTVEGMADSTWCNASAPDRFQDLQIDSFKVDLARVRLTGDQEHEFLRSGTGIVFSYDADTLTISSDVSAGVVAANNGLSLSGDTVQLGGTLIKNTAINGAYDLKIGNTTALDTFSVNAARVNIDLSGQRFLHTTGGGGGGGSYENLFLGYQAGAGFSGNGYANTILGRRAGNILSGTAPNASSNILIGYGAGELATTASFNTIVGTAAGSALSTTTNSTLVGYHAGRLQTGSFVTAVGEKSLEKNTASNGNTAVGYSALGNNTSGNNSTAVGYEAGNAVTTSGKGVFVGYHAGRSVTDEENTFVGYRAGGAGAGIASYNTVVGSDAGLSLTDGNTNAFFGRYAGTATTSGSANVFLGKNAAETNTIGSNNIVVGRNIGLSSASASNELNIGGAIYATSLYGTSLVGIEIAAPARTLDVNGEVRVRDLTTDTPTGVVGHDADGDLATLGLSGLSVVSGVLTAADPSTTNEIQTYGHAGTTSYTNTLSSGGGAFTLQGGGLTSISHTAGTVTISSAVQLANNGVSDNESAGFYRLGNRYMNGADAPFTMPRKININSQQLFFGDNGDSTQLLIDASSDRIGVRTGTPQRDFHVNGEVRVTDLTTDTPTRLLGADGDGDFGEVAVGSGLNLFAGTLSASGGTNYQTLRWNGTAQTQQPNANFIDGTVVSWQLSNDGPNSETEVRAGVVANSISNALFRQSAAKSVVGVSGNAPANVGDVSATAANQVLRVNTGNTSIGWGNIVPAAVTVAANNVILGNDSGAGANAQELTPAECQTMLGYVDGTGVANRFAYWSDANTITSDAAFTLNATTDRATFTGSTTGTGVGTGVVNIGLTAAVGAATTAFSARGQVNGSNWISELINTSTSANSNAIETIAVSDNAAGDPYTQYQIAGAGGTTTSVGLDNSNGNKFLISVDQTSLDQTLGQSLTLRMNGGVLTGGVGTNAPVHMWDVIGNNRAKLFIGQGNEYTSANVTFGAGAGTGPSVSTISGSGNSLEIVFATGTSPTADGDVFTVTYPYSFPSNSTVVPGAARTETANEIGKFFISADGTTSFTLKARGSLTASTTYKINFIYAGY